MTHHTLKPDNSTVCCELHRYTLNYAHTIFLCLPLSHSQYFSLSVNIFCISPSLSLFSFSVPFFQHFPFCEGHFLPHLHPQTFASACALLHLTFTHQYEILQSCRKMCRRQVAFASTLPHARARRASLHNPINTIHRSCTDNHHGRNCKIQYHIYYVPVCVLQQADLNCVLQQ